MAGVTGLEPAASCVTGRRSNQLSYTPAKPCGLFFLWRKPSEARRAKDGGRSRTRTADPLGVNEML